MYDHNAFTRQAVGGVTRYFAEITSKMNHHRLAEARIFAPFHFNYHIANLSTSETVGLCVPNFKGAGRLLPVINEALHQRALSKFRPDLLHETHYSGRNYKFKDHIPIVYTVHDLIPELFPAQFTTYSKFTKLREKCFQSNAYFVCVSENTRTDFKRLFEVPDERITVIHHGGPKVVRVPIEERQNSVLFVGNRKGYKNFDGILNAFSLSDTLRSHTKLTIFGGGELSNHEKLRIARSGITRFEHLHGDDDVLATAYRQCGLFVYPSHYEGFGLPLLEAMAAGAPVVCANASCFPEIAGDAAEYFDPSQPEQISMLISRLLSNAVRLRELTHVGYERAQMFTWQTSAEKHAEFYKHVLRLNHG